MTSALFAPSLVGLSAATLAATYSADRIATSGTVKAPISFGGYAWVCVSTSNNAADAYMLVDPRDFTGATYTYNEKTSIWRDGDEYAGDFARSDPNGFYHGMLTGELLTPRPSISGRTGRMEAHSPLFANSEANPQLSLFGGQQ